MDDRTALMPLSKILIFWFESNLKILESARLPIFDNSRIAVRKMLLVTNDYEDLVLTTSEN